MNALPEKQAGTFGAYSNIQSTESSSFIGFISALISGCAILFIVIRYMIHGDPTSGWASMVCIMLFIGGIQLFCLGIVGKYIGKIFTEVKHRPIYIVKEKK